MRASDDDLWHIFASGRRTMLEVVPVDRQNDMDTLLRMGLAALCFALAAIGPIASADEAKYGLRTIPTEVFQSNANAKEGLVGWVFFLIVESDTDTTMVPIDLKLEYLAAGRVVRDETLHAAALKTISIPGVNPSRLTGTSPETPTFWPHAFRMVVQVPAALNVDTMRAQLRAMVGQDVHAFEKVFAIEQFAQRTQLIFPFVGHGLITQAGVLESGHRNRSGLFAIDVLGLTPTYAPVLDDGESPKSYAGWGREIIAPAAGVVVGVRNDRPDQPVTGLSDPKFFAPEYPNGGDPGNHIVIDHGNAEFSLIAHLQQGSVRVNLGDQIEQGAPLGLLGNSGDTSGPHLHYQLQRGPKWEFSDGLPAKFENVPQVTRGSYFSATARPAEEPKK